MDNCAGTGGPSPAPHGSMPDLHSPALANTPKMPPGQAYMDLHWARWNIELHDSLNIYPLFCSILALPTYHRTVRNGRSMYKRICTYPIPGQNPYMRLTLALISSFSDLSSHPYTYL